MKKVIRLTESDLTRIVKRIIKESNGDELEEDYFDLEDYAANCVSNFTSFLNEHTD